MDRRDKLFAVALGTATLLSPGVQATAQPNPVEKTAAMTTKVSDSSMATPYGSHLDPILTKINATPDQRQKISAVVASYKPKIEPLRQEYREKSQQFVNFIVTGQPAETVMERQGELNKLYSVIVTQYSLMQLEIRKHLNANQTRLFEEYKRQQGWAAR